MTMELDSISLILYLYWICDFLLVLYGLPTTLDWISPPEFLRELFLYGKTREAEVKNPLVKFIEIPKAWFKHYYIYGVIVSSYMVAVTAGCFIFNHDIPGRNFLMNFIGDRTPVLDEYAVIMICLMMLFQHCRRIYECIFVSVYSKGTMNILHYLLGFLLYSTVQICAICDGPALKLSSKEPVPIANQLQTINFAEVVTKHWNKILGALLFLWASYYHNQSHEILANLRKDRSGNKVLHRQHVIPRGGMFEYLSAPHFVCVMLIYIAMGIVAINSWTFWMGPVLFTITNQALMCNETHKWYNNNFDNYPKNRCRFIPYIL